MCPESALALPGAENYWSETQIGESAYMTSICPFGAQTRWTSRAKME
jgi:hypothetical protein